MVKRVTKPKREQRNRRRASHICFYLSLIRIYVLVVFFILRVTYRHRFIDRICNSWVTVPATVWVGFLVHLFVSEYGRQAASVAFKPAGYNYNRWCGWCLEMRWESPRKQWPCSSTREMAKLLPSAGIVEKVFNYLIDRVTGARTQPLPRHPARCNVAKTHVRMCMYASKSTEGTTLDVTLSVGLAAPHLNFQLLYLAILYSWVDFEVVKW